MARGTEVDNRKLSHMSRGGRGSAAGALRGVVGAAAQH